MARILYANHFAWSSAEVLSSFKGGGSVGAYSMQLRNILSANVTTQGSVMPTEGVVVGFIVFVGNHSSCSRDTTYSVRKTTFASGYSILAIMT